MFVCRFILSYVVSSSEDRVVRRCINDVCVPVIFRRIRVPAMITSLIFYTCSLAALGGKKGRPRSVPCGAKARRGPVVSSTGRAGGQKTPSEAARSSLGGPPSSKSLVLLALNVHFWFSSPRPLEATRELSGALPRVWGGAQGVQDGARNAQEGPQDGVEKY